MSVSVYVCVSVCVYDIPMWSYVAFLVGQWEEEYGWNTGAEGQRHQRGIYVSWLWCPFHGLQFEVHGLLMDYSLKYTGY